MYSMKTAKFSKIMSLVIVLLVIIIGFFVYTNQSAPPAEILEHEVVQTGEISLTIEGLYDDRMVQIYSGDTVLGVLERLQEEDSNVLLVTKEYSGLGVLVEGINDLTNGEDNKYWQFNVNDVMPQIGADKLELEDGDVVEWHFSESEF